MRVLVPIDESHYASAQLDYIQPVRWQQEPQFRLLHVLHAHRVRASVLSPSSHSEKIVEQGERYYENVLRESRERLLEEVPDATVNREIKSGRPAEVILSAAREWPADLIVLASHGRAGVSKSIMGSVSELVLANAPCRVIVVGLPKSSATEFHCALSPIGGSRSA